VTRCGLRTRLAVCVWMLASAPRCAGSVQANREASRGSPRVAWPGVSYLCCTIACRRLSQVYRDWGRRIFENINKYARVESGFASIRDVQVSGTK
jgi:hypothetical protein